MLEHEEIAKLRSCKQTCKHCHVVCVMKNTLSVTHLAFFQV